MNAFISFLTLTLCWFDNPKYLYFVYIYSVSFYIYCSKLLSTLYVFIYSFELIKHQFKLFG